MLEIRLRGASLHAHNSTVRILYHVSAVLEPDMRYDTDDFRGVVEC